MEGGRRATGREMSLFVLMSLLSWLSEKAWGRASDRQVSADWATYLR